MVSRKKMLDKLRLERDEYIAQRDWRNALKVVNQMLFLEPLPSFYTRRGMIWIKLKNYPQAIDDLKKALSLDPKEKKAKAVLSKLCPTAAKVSFPQIPVAVEHSIHDLVDGEHDSIASMIQPAQKITRFASYDIIEKIGRGTISKVYKARDTNLKRIIALKVLSNEETKNTRFLKETQATVQLRHSNIVSVYDIGIENNQMFFTMDFIEGITLKDYLLQNAVTPHQAVHILAQVCEALDYAHSQKIIHHDLKPSNIMINSLGRPLVSDFGLAKAMYETPQDASFSNTPAYMSPEQIARKRVDHRTDIYAVGAIMYELLVKRPPFEGESFRDVVQQVLKQDIVPLRRLNPGISPDLQAICMKCLEKNPSQRYQSIAQLIHDLQNFSEDRPVKARISAPLASLRRFIVHNFLLCVMIFGINAALLLSSWMFFQQWQQEHNLRKQLEHLNSYIHWTFNPIKNIVATWTYNQGIEIWDTINHEKLHFLPTQKQQINSLVFHPEEAVLAYSCNQKIMFWNFSDNQQQNFTNTSETIQKLLFSSEGNILVSSSGNSLQVWNSKTKEQLGKFKLDASIEDFRLNPNNETIFVQSAKKVYIWEIKSQTVLSCFPE